MPNTSMNLLFTILITHINMYERLYYTFLYCLKNIKVGIAIMKLIIGELTQLFINLTYNSVILYKL